MALNGIILKTLSLGKLHSHAFTVRLYECWVCVHAVSLKVIVWIRRLVNKIRCTGNPVLENSCASITPQKAVTFNDDNGDNANTSRDINAMK